MTKFLVVALFLLIQGIAPVSAQDSKATKAVKSAMEAISKGKWAEAAVVSAPAGQVGRDIVDWHRLRSTAGNFDEFVDFLERRSDWPGLPLLRKSGETRIPKNADADAVIAYFSDQLPQTGTGSLRLVAALEAKGAKNDAEAEIVRAWKGFSLSEAEEKAFLAKYKTLLAPHHVARQDMLLWKNKTSEAERLNPLVGKGQQALVKARVGLMQKKNGVDAMITAVPPKLIDDPGLAYARFMWRVGKGRKESAIAIILKHSTSAKALGNPEAWANQRRSMARQKMRDGKAKIAYQLASQNFLTQGNAFTDLEWLAGFIALTDLNDPKKALEHFQRFRVAVDSPISMGRAGYWEGRAHEALGEEEAALAAYSFGAEHQTSFYGQLAAEKAGIAMDPLLVGQEVYPNFLETPHGNSSVFQAAMLFQKAGHPLLFARFTRHLAETLNAEERGALAQVALDLDEPFAALFLAKYAANSGTVLMRPYFPVTNIVKGDLSVPHELALAIARRESEFYPGAKSPVGARGLMQLMPRTGKAMAQKLGVSFQLDRLITDPTYNASLGSAYLAELIDDFGPYYPFVAAGYNAGPSRPKKWAKIYGNPRRSPEHAVDWIEHIPFRETRNYVMRVMESLPVYRARLAGKAVPLNMSKELVGG